MNSTEFKRNKPKLIQNRDRNYFLAIADVRPVKDETLNQAIFENGYKAFMQPSEASRNKTPVSTFHVRRNFLSITN